MGRVLSTMILAILALFYAYGALLHAFSITGFAGIDWSATPLRWRILDILYLVLDFAVALCLVLWPAPGVVLLWIAAAGQILLYTILRDWTLDVPPAFLPTDAERGHLDALVRFHIGASIAAFTALRLRR